MTQLATIILAAGRGTRMHSALHKVLHPIAGRPMILHLMDRAAVLSPQRTVLIVGDGAQQVRDVLGKEVEYAVQDRQLGTGHAVSQARDMLRDFSGDVLVLYGDVPFVRADTLTRLRKRLHAPDQPAVAVLGFRPADTRGYGRIIADGAGHIEQMVEHKDADDAQRACTLCNSGVLAARATDLFALLDRIGNDNAQGEYYLTDIVNLATSDGRACAVVETADAAEVAGINDRAELARAEAQWQETSRQEAMAAGVTMRACETVFLSWDTRFGRDVTIEPHVVFGPGVHIADNVTIRAFSHIEGARIESGVEVGPFARLRPGSVLEEGSRLGNFVEMKQAVLGKGAKANHLSYLGDAHIGANANIGAGTITCNYDGYFKHRTTIGERAFIGSNSALVAPLTIGADAIVAAGSTVSRDVADGELRMVRADQLIKPGWADRFHDLMRKKKQARNK
ncbi:bifunctional UDP-N-acetylglucosamine diphosphorylase/glucosamine-1-phosphate N-acetyltransferase GlmU [Croceicoccus sp. F390]|uniref:Bifunctional protein GlmU n=1 Tax=Croceicoccus esteveae TaxID=3075597 RepID=A0ABU2ZDY4_9SPHN|nr:bifunctional UDP-N-acetylglucosamine diphosphorylase/glucosamine-1-phosphate N-acetyltransferase GlmU [Croceicoccus sp. F390]MDT0574813.1 bifunctional UDP-N-acetylglucosamine diphosphorylase/glucosamine-1-phosphate N-acetyltransferase GlmU [Croceicoccus sp. F390]